MSITGPPEFIVNFALFCGMGQNISGRYFGGSPVLHDGQRMSQSICRAELEMTSVVRALLIPDACCATNSAFEKQYSQHS